MLMAVTTVLAALVALRWGYNPLLVARGQEDLDFEQIDVGRTIFEIIGTAPSCAVYSWSCSRR